MYKLYTKWIRETVLGRGKRKPKYSFKLKRASQAPVAGESSGRGLGENLKCNLVQFSTSNILNTSNR